MEDVAFIFAQTACENNGLSMSDIGFLGAIYSFLGVIFSFLGVICSFLGVICSFLSAIRG